MSIDATTQGNLHSVTLLFFDRYNAEDPLFVADVGRRMANAARQGFKALVVHASDDAVDRVVEAYDGSERDAPEVKELVERAVRLTNQSITRRLIDEGVAAVSIQGCDRGLLQAGNDGVIHAGNTEWLERTVHLGAVPVVSLLALSADRSPTTVESGAALDVIVSALAENWSVTLVYFTTNRKSGLGESDGTRVESVGRDMLETFEELPDPVRFGTVADKTQQVIVTNSAGLSEDGTISGTRII